MSEHTDALDETLRYLRDVEQDVEPMAEGGFQGGFHHAVYLVAEMVLRTNDGQPCDCKGYFPELRSDEEWAADRWVCCDCGTPICNWGAELEE